MKKVAILTRKTTSDQGTEGILATPGLKCFSLELPWRENRGMISCIPNGEYETQIRVSPKFGRIYWVMRVGGREYILIHSANWAGDIEKGFRTHLNGCITLGLSMGFLGGQRAVLNSRIAIRQFMEHMGYQSFMLKITGGNFDDY